MKMNQISKNNIEILKERGINSFFHITYAKNLQSILTYGLYSYARLKANKIRFTSFDQTKFNLSNKNKDLSSIFLTLSYYYMLNNFSTKPPKNEMKDNAILEIDIAILDNNKAQYFPHLHTSKEFKKPIYRETYFTKTEAVERLFSNHFTVTIRDRSDITLDENKDFNRKDNRPIFEPTNEFSEILVKNEIPVQFIKAIYFYKKESKDIFDNQTYNYDIQTGFARELIFDNL